jgi:hypothetical protein
MNAELRFALEEQGQQYIRISCKQVKNALILKQILK